MPDNTLNPGEFYISPNINQFDQIKPYLEKIRSGDPITDEGLMIVHSYLKDLAERLWPLGPTFTLATREVERLFQTCEGYRRARIQG